MKRFFTLSLLVLSMTAAYACGPSGPLNYNYYMYNICGEDDTYSENITQRLAEAWSGYVGRRVTAEEMQRLAALRPGEVDTTSLAIVACARQKKDNEMLDYLRLLADYLAATPEYDQWSYPSKEELAQHAAAQCTIYERCATYKNKRLRDRYVLLAMRSLFRQERYGECISLWQAESSRLSASIFRDMTEGFYAGALMRSDRREEACAAYARLGDARSARFCLKDSRNLSCMRRLYAQDPQSPIFKYLLQDFVNNAQETLDFLRQSSTYEYYSTPQEWFDMIGGSPVFEQEVRGFVAWADSVAAEGRTDAPAMWKAATALLRYYYGENETALRDAEMAVSMGGPQPVAENARVIRLLVSTATAPAANRDDYTHFLLPEVQWLTGKTNSKESGNVRFELALDRIFHQGLIPLFRHWGDDYAATALLGLMTEGIVYEPAPKSSDDDDAYYSYNGSYSNSYFNRLDAMSVDSLVAYRDFIFSTHSASAFHQWLAQSLPKQAAFYDDLIGTKLLRLGRFAEAEPWLVRVPLDFLSTQNISPYAARRDYGVERWFKKQKLSWEEEHETPVTVNKKLTFCREMLKKEQAYARAAGEQRLQMAYELAVRYYQASFRGDCWFLTRYGVSTYSDSLRPTEADFARRAATLLAESKKSARRDLHEKSLYAAAFICYEPWRTQHFDYDKLDFVFTVHRGHQYEALTELWKYTSTRKDAPAYFSRCDQLMEFARSEITGKRKP